MLILVVSLALDPQVLLQTTLALKQALRPRARDRIGRQAAMLVKLVARLAQRSASALVGSQVLGQLIAARLPIELILASVDIARLLQDLPSELLVVEV